MSVRVVTDSTADIPAPLAQELEITVVPLNVTFGSQVFKDGVDLSSDEFYRRLESGGEFPTTSQPSPGEFVEVYERVGQEADGIVSIHVSAKLSGTLNSANQARRQAAVDCPIELVDTGQASMGVGLIVLRAARLARQGASLEEVVATAQEAIGRVRCFALLDTLEYLHRGGRIGRARALLGSLLRIKPMVEVSDGEVLPLDRPRSWARGVARLRELATQQGPVEDMAVMYGTNEDEAVELADQVADVLPQGKRPIVARFGSTLGTYVGPRSLGVGLLLASAGPGP